MKGGLKMNKTELSVEMLRHGDNQEKLADALGISSVSLSKKINDKGEFSRGEISTIASRYQLTPERLAEIFFAENMNC
jgi:transcriptional regulator with XRE-family HTH domain